jgi:hypothetical protein
VMHFVVCKKLERRRPTKPLEAFMKE